MCTCCIVILGWILIKLPVLSDNYMFNQPSIKFPVLSDNYMFNQPSVIYSINLRLYVQSNSFSAIIRPYRAPMAIAWLILTIISLIVCL